MFPTYPSPNNSWTEELPNGTRHSNTGAEKMGDMEMGWVGV